MEQIEKSTKVWQSVFGTTPTREGLQVARAMECNPRHIRLNLWETPSTTREGVFYRQEVYFNGISDASDIGYGLHIDCTCPSAEPCIHAIRIENKYQANWKFYFYLFGLSDDVSFAELHEKALMIDEKLKANSYRRAA